MFLSKKQFRDQQQGKEIEPEAWQVVLWRDARRIARRRHEATLALNAPEITNGAPRIATSSRPRGGRPAARSSSRSTRGSPDDDPSKPESDPCERPCDRLLRDLRNSYDDAYRVTEESGGGWAWWARCPCAPDAGHTMFVMDMGDDRMPGIACQHNCSVPGILRMLGFVTPEEEETERRAHIFLEELERYRAWVAERRAS